MQNFPRSDASDYYDSSYDVHAHLEQMNKELSKAKLAIEPLKLADNFKHSAVLESHFRDLDNYIRIKYNLSHIPAPKIFVLDNNKETNAQVMSISSDVTKLEKTAPGVFIYSGLLKALKHWNQFDAIVTHELGHYYLGHVTHDKDLIKYREDSAFEETEADAFAIHILKSLGLSPKALQDGLVAMIMPRFNDISPKDQAEIRTCLSAYAHSWQLHGKEYNPVLKSDRNFYRSLCYRLRNADMIAMNITDIAVEENALPLPQKEFTVLFGSSFMDWSEINSIF